MTAQMSGPLRSLRELACTKAIGVLQLPAPMVRTHLLQGPRRRPAQRILRKGRVGIADGDITGPALHDFIGDGPPARRFECANDVQDTVPVACSKVDREQTGWRKALK